MVQTSCTLQVRAYGNWKGPLSHQFLAYVARERGIFGAEVIFNSGVKTLRTHSDWVDAGRLLDIQYTLLATDTSAQEAVPELEWFVE